MYVPTRAYMSGLVLLCVLVTSRINDTSSLPLPFEMGHRTLAPAQLCTYYHHHGRPASTILAGYNLRISVNRRLDTPASAMNELNRGYLHPFWDGALYYYGVGELPRTVGCFFPI